MLAKKRTMSVFVEMHIKRGWSEEIFSRAFQERGVATA